MGVNLNNCGSHVAVNLLRCWDFELTGCYAADPVIQYGYKRGILPLWTLEKRECNRCNVHERRKSSVDRSQICSHRVYKTVDQCSSILLQHAWFRWVDRQQGSVTSWSSGSGVLEQRNISDLAGQGATRARVGKTLQFSHTRGGKVISVSAETQATQVGKEKSFNPFFFFVSPPNTVCVGKKKSSNLKQQKKKICTGLFQHQQTKTMILLLFFFLFFFFWLTGKRLDFETCMFCATSNQKGPGRYEIWLVCIQVHQWLNLFLYFFIFFFWQQCYSEVDWNCIWTTIFFTGPIYKKSWFFDCHSQLVNYWRSGMVRQVGRHLHSTSDDLKMRLKNELFFQMGPFLKKKNMCFHLFVLTFTRYSSTEPLWRRRHPPNYEKLYHQMILKLLL